MQAFLSFVIKENVKTSGNRAEQVKNQVKGIVDIAADLLGGV